jgi:hypothetical protein
MELFELLFKMKGLKGSSPINTIYMPTAGQRSSSKQEGGFGV